jgi:TolB-like protein
MPNKLSHFWQELKRRKVTRTVTVYAAAAFVILELVDIVAPNLELPIWTFNLVLILLLVGFVIAVILSWIYDIHPEGGMVKTEPAHKVKDGDRPKSSNSWKIASYISFVVIVGLVMLNIFGGNRRLEIDESLSRSIAVLPFHNFSTEPDQEQMCLGLTNEIIGHLFRIKSFEKVTPFTSVLTYIGNDKRSSEIAEELGVNYILEGTYTKIGEQLRVTVNLVEPKKERQIWQHEYDQPYNEIISLQSDIALQIADHLKAFLNVSETEIINRIPTNNMEAYETLHKAGYLFNSQRFGAVSQAIEFGEEAIRLDPEYSDAYAWVGILTLWNGTVWGQKEIQYAALDALPYLEKALELDQNNATAHYGMAQIEEWIRWDYIKAEKEYLNAIELEPNNPYLYNFVAEFYLKRHQLESLKAIFDKAPEKEFVSSSWELGLRPDFTLNLHYKLRIR